MARKKPKKAAVAKKRPRRSRVIKLPKPNGVQSVTNVAPAETGKGKPSLFDLPTCSKSKVVTGVDPRTVKKLFEGDGPLEPQSGGLLPDDYWEKRFS